MPNLVGTTSALAKILVCLDSVCFITRQIKLMIIIIVKKDGFDGAELNIIKIKLVKETKEKEKTNILYKVYSLS